MSRVEENDHIELAAGEGKEEVAQLNDTGAVTARVSRAGSGTAERVSAVFFVLPCLDSRPNSWEKRWADGRVGFTHRYHIDPYKMCPRVPRLDVPGIFLQVTQPAATITLVTCQVYQASTCLARNSYITKRQQSTPPTHVEMIVAGGNFCEPKNLTSPLCYCFISWTQRRIFLDLILHHAQVPAFSGMVGQHTPLLPLPYMYMVSGMMTSGVCQTKKRARFPRDIDCKKKALNICRWLYLYHG